MCQANQDKERRQRKDHCQNLLDAKRIDAPDRHGYLDEYGAF
jgi:hypothetical protein